MSMLAECRRKQKWSDDPQGKRWSKDNEKIGQKILEKMGWSNGKGLGVNEQGILEHVRVNKRNPENEKAGIGYDKDAYMKDLYEHQDKFNELLQHLSKHHNQGETVGKSESNVGNVSEQSLEIKPKQNHARLHYQKFVRNKDVSKYNSKDLASIFGKKELINKTEDNMEEENKNICENEPIDIKDNWGVVTINRGSMSDYFKQKLSNYKKTSSNNTIDNQAPDSESETEQRVGFGFTSEIENTYFTNEVPKNSDEKSNYAFDNPCLGMNSPMETTLNAENSTKKSKKKRRKEFVLESFDLHIKEMSEVNDGKRLKTRINSICKDGFTNLALNLNTKPNEACNGKEFEVSRAQFGLENCGLDLTDEESNKKRVTFNDHVEYNLDATKGKKRKATLDKFEVQSKKHKKKQKRENVATLSNGFVNEALDVEVLSMEINDNELNECKNSKIKKRKIRKTSSLETIQESPEREKEILEIKLEDVILDTTEDIDKETDAAAKKSKKKKKNKKEGKIMGNDIVEFESEEEDIIGKIIKNKKHKLNKKREISSKEKKKDKEECETAPNGMLEKLETEQQHTNHLVKIKNKKRRKQEVIIEDLAKVEMSPAVTTTREESVSLEKENTVQKKKKKVNSKKNHLENEINTCDVEKEVSDKENAVEKQELNQVTKTKLSKKYKKRKRSEDALDTESSTNLSANVTDTDISNQQNVNNAEFIRPSRKSQVIDFMNDVIHSPLNRKERMTKTILKRLFYGNMIADFPGSNIREIKGYGVGINDN